MSRLSERFKNWLEKPSEFTELDLANEFSLIRELILKELQTANSTHKKPEVLSLCTTPRTEKVDIREALAYAKTLFDDLYTGFIPWKPVQTEEYHQKAEEMRQFLLSNPSVLQTKFFQVNIGKQRWEIIQYWLNHLD